MTFRLNSNLSLSGKKEGSFMYKINELYDLDHTLAKDYLAKFEYPWQALSGIKDLILELGKNLGEDYVEVKEHVWVHKSANVFESAYLGAPCIIGPETEVRHCFCAWKCFSGRKLRGWKQCGIKELYFI